MQLIRCLILTMLAATSVRAQDRSTQLAADTLYYTDDNGVRVVSPQVSARHTLDAEGGAISGRFVVDAISAASVDVITQATQSFDEIRYEADVSASKTFGDLTPQASYRFSWEPDYVSHGGYGEAIFIGSRDGNDAIGLKLPKDGDYTIRVYLMGNDKDSGQTVHYQLSMTIM